MTTKGTVEKTSDKELRRSERNKGNGASGKDDFSLSAPPPLQVKERLLACVKTSTPTKEVPLDEEAQLDKTLGELERSIHETERRLKEMVDQQRVKGKEDKLECMRKALDKTQKKLKDAEEEGENKAKDVVKSDLIENEKLTKKAHKTLADLGLVSDTDETSSESSESSGSLKFLNQLKPSFSRKHKKEERFEQRFFIFFK